MRERHEVWTTAPPPMRSRQVDGLRPSQDPSHRPNTRAGWAIALLAVVLGTTFLILLALNSVAPRIDSGESWLAGAVMAIVFPATGALIVARHPAHRLGWLMLVIGLLTAV